MIVKTQSGAILLFRLLLFILPLMFQPASGQEVPVIEHLADTPIIEFKFHFPVKKFFNAPSVAWAHDTLYLFADFEHVYTLNVKNGALHRFTPLDEIGRPLDRTSYQPTGLFYDPSSNKLFVANYLKNNVMIFSVDFKKRTLALLSIIAHTDVVSPEGVWFDKKTHLLTITNSDGHSVCVFRISDKPAQHMWTQKLGYAHGVAIYAGKIYATGLLDRVIQEFDLKTGTPLRRMGHLGWDTAAGGFLWPISIYPDGIGNLIVSDAETGYISTLRISDLSVVNVQGGNGPGLSFFNQPYMTIVNKNKFLTISTKQNRFVFGSYPGFRPLKVFAMNRHMWGHLKSNDPALRLGESGWKGYRWTSGPTIHLLEHDFQIELNWLNQITRYEQRVPVLRLANIPTPFGFNNFKQLQAMTRGEYYLFLSPASPNGTLVATERFGKLFTARISGENDCWMISNKIFCPNSELEPTKVVESFESFISRLQTHRCANGAIPYPIALKVIGNFRKEHGIALDGLQKDFLETFQTAEGKRFWKEYIQVTTCDDDISGLVKAQREALQSFQTKGVMNIDEYSWVSVLR